MDPSLSEVGVVEEAKSNVESPNVLDPGSVSVIVREVSDEMVKDWSASEAEL